MADQQRTRIRVRPIIRVFVSSTFSDLKLERDALAQRVWPKLEQLCLQEGFQFQAIDLRWGVPTEAGLHHGTMRICFEELRRSQEISPEPNFLILLGNRYGWRPLPEEISAEEFQRLEDAAGQIDVGNQQRPVDVLRQWYLLDENSLKPVYILQPRRKPRDDNNDRTDCTALEAWRPVEQTLWKIIDHNRAFPPDELRNRFQYSPPSEETPPSIVRFQASATEQEIWAGALSVPNAKRHVRAFFRDITNRDDFSPIEVKDFFDLTGAGDFNDNCKTAQEQLKDAIRSRLGDNVIFPVPYSRLKRHKGKVGIDASEDEIQHFCDDVEQALKEIIERQIREYWEPKASDAANGESLSDRRTARELEIERDEHLRFGREQGSRDFFVGRNEEDGPLARIRNYLGKDSRYPLVIHGESGCGKTALLARSLEMIPEDKQPMIRFLGVTPRSSDVRSLLTSLCQELRGRNAIATALSTNIQELTQEFHQHLEAATPERPVILFLDALDQLSYDDSALQLFWLPGTISLPLPLNAKIVVSCLSERTPVPSNSRGDSPTIAPASQPFDALKRRQFPAENFVSLDCLSPTDAKKLLFDHWLPDAGRTFDDGDENQASQRRLIEARLVSDDQCRQPLFLKLLFEEVKRWRSYNTNFQLYGEGSVSSGFVDGTNEELRATRASSNPHIDALLQQLIDRLSQKENHGPLLVQRALGYVAAARRGLSETEILEVLFADREYKKKVDDDSEHKEHELPTEPPRIPIAIWARLRSDLAPYLTERSVAGANVLTFYHRQLGEWVTSEFVEDAKWNPHGSLAEFFRKQDYYLESLEDHRVQKQIPDTRRRAAAFVRITSFLQSLFLRNLRDDDRPSHGRPNSRKVDELPWQLVESAEWTRLSDLFADSPFFCIAWNLRADDVKRYWSRLQSAVPSVRIRSVFKDVLAFPRRYEDKFLWCVATFFQEVGSLDETLVVRRELRHRAVSGANTAMLAGALGNEAEVLRLRGELPKAYPLQLKATELFRLQENHVALARGLVNLALMDATLGNIDRALQRNKDAESYFRILGDLKGQATCNRNRAEIMRDQGSLAEALQLAEDAEALAIRNDDRLGRARALGIRGDVCRERGDLDRAAKFLAEANHVFQQLGDSDGLANVLGGQGLVMWERAARVGPPEDREFLDKSLQFHREEETCWRQIGDSTGLARCLANQARIHGIEARYDEAMRLCEQAKTYGLQSGDRIVLRLIHGHMERIRRGRGH